MESELEISQREIEAFRQQLEGLLPDQINGIEIQSELMVRLMYVQDSVRLEYLECGDDPLTPYHSGWTYIVQQNEVYADCFVPTMIHTGYIDIPVGPDGSLLTGEADFLKGLLPPSEVYT